ncbi:MAG: AMP-binding protein, partial [bacterium]|nr:AMP-binding protein [bacterium]
TPDDRLSLVTSFCHDQSVQDLYAGLLTGATLCPYYMKNRTSTLNIDLSEFMKTQGVTVWHSVPSLFSYFTGTLADTETFPQIRLILLGGEPMRKHELDMCQKHFPNARLASVYGQTESSVNSIWLMNPDEPFNKLLIGTPLDKTRIFLVNERGREVVPFENGEILVACPHISPGYWKNEQATKKNFSCDPMFGRLYWTGDQGRLMLDGSIEYIGRKDSQVKIRGYRIELGEIETHLLSHHLIKETVVTIKTDSTGDPFLSAYFVTTTNQEKTLDPLELREYLKTDLPDYMVPAYFVQLDHFPLTTSGKIDRKALPGPQIKGGDSYLAPRNMVEHTLLEIWSEVLGKTNSHTSQSEPYPGINDNFFEIGGHSLKAAIMVSKIHKRLNVNVPLSEVFQTPTIQGLSCYIEQSRTDSHISIEPVEKRQYYPLSSAQKRLFLLERLKNTGTGYNLPYILKIKGDLNFQVFEKVLNLLIERHETLRTSFRMVAGEPVQCVHDRVNVNIEYYGHVSSPVHEGTAPPVHQETSNSLISRFIRPFDLSQAPLIRAGLAPLTGDQYLFLFDMHHIISDGT